MAGKMGKASPTAPTTASGSGRAPSASTRTTPGRSRASRSTIFPGDLGGVETPMALAGNRLFVPWVDLATRASATGLGGRGIATNFSSGRGGLAAVDAATGKVALAAQLPSMDFGAATVANDVVFTSTYAGTIYAFDTKTGKTLWTAKAPAGINSFPAVDGDTLLVGAGAPGFVKKPQFQLIAYSLSLPRRRHDQRSVRVRVRTPATSPTSATHGAGQGRRVLLQALDQVAREARHRRRSCSRTSATSLHDFKINGKRTPLIQPGKTAQARRHVQEEGQVPLPLHRPRPRGSGHEGRLHRPLTSRGENHSDGRTRDPLHGRVDGDRRARRARAHERRAPRGRLRRAGRAGRPGRPRDTTPSSSSPPASPPASSRRCSGSRRRGSST